MRQLLNRTTAPKIFSLFDLCFKHGVIDAYELGDDYAVREFIDLHKDDFSFGELGQPNDYTWKMWVFTLYRWCRISNLSTFADNYLYSVKQTNYTWCPILLSMRYYLMGMEEWLKYSNPTKIEIFKRKPKTHWVPKPTAIASAFTKKSYMMEIEQMCFEYKRIDEKSRPINDTQLDIFCTAMFHLTSKIIIRKSLKFADTKIKNI